LTRLAATLGRPIVIYNNLFVEVDEASKYCIYSAAAVTTPFIARNNYHDVTDFLSGFDEDFPTFDNANDTNFPLDDPSNATPASDDFSLVSGATARGTAGPGLLEGLT
jgi:hypothetical protein